MADDHADPGSFRDPSSRVYAIDGEIVRGLDREATDELQAVWKTRFWERALESQQVIGTDWLGAAPAGITDEWVGWLRHDRVPFITYPYEWTFEMLRSAARLQLRLLLDGLADDIMLKDASAYNVQFIGSHPVFIDVGSFERYRDGDPWYGYRQFCQLFLYPLLFEAYKGLPFQPWLRGSVDGIDPDEARRVLSGFKRHWKGVLTHVELHARAEGRMGSTDRDVKGDLRSAGFNRKLIEANLTKLSGLVDDLEPQASMSEWSEYSDRSHYTAGDLAKKEEVVRRVAAEQDRALVWDIGANDGHFSRLVAEHADYVLALDADRLVVDRLFLDLVREDNRSILPLVMNLADPSPGLGWRGLERRTLDDRGRPDLVLALAVIHHIAITANVPILAFVDYLAELTPELVIEFPTPSDQMVKRLLRNKRAGVHDDYTVEGFEAVLAERFEVHTREELASKTRILYHATRR
jgi:hypothetical protein